MECDNRFYLYTGHKFLCTISSTSVTIKKSPLSNFRIVSEQGRTKDLKTQNWQLYKSPERASAVSTNIWGDQPSRRSGSGFIVFGSEAWVPVTSLGACDQSVCLEEYQLPVELDTKDLPQFLLLLLGSALGESWVVWVDSAWHCTSPHLHRKAHPTSREPLECQTPCVHCLTWATLRPCHAFLCFLFTSSVFSLFFLLSLLTQKKN